MAEADRQSTPEAESPRGKATRQRILLAALRTFARDGYEATTTRRLATAAGVNLPAIAYYFGNKEGLYRACAHEIVARYRAGIGTVVARAAHDAPELDAETARSRLKQIMRLLASLAENEALARASTQFVLREIGEGGPAFEILYCDLWQPGMELTAWLIARIERQRAPDESHRIEALLLHASMTAFSATRPVSLRYLDAGDRPDEAIEHALAAIDRQIDAMGVRARSADR